MRASNTVVISNVEQARPDLRSIPGGGPTRARPFKLRAHSVVRWLHIYTSMVCLLIVLFFALTGVTLNHPNWLATENTKTVAGTLSPKWKTTAGVDWLDVAEELKAAYGVHGTSGDRRADDSGASISFKSPGYEADAEIDVATGKYQLTVASQGLIGVMNDLHRGRDAGSAWGWVIDATGYFLVLISVTGLVLLVYLKKVRMRALLTMLGGAVLFGALAALAG